MSPTATASSTSRPEPVSPMAGRDDLRRILHDVDDARFLEILNLSPTVAEVEQAAIWAAGDGHAVDRAGHPLSGTVARLVGILQRDEEPDR